MKRYRLGISSQSVPSGASAFRVRIAGNNVELRFPESERAVFEHEFGEIFLRDCYGIASLPDDIRTVLDVGANLGLFSLAAIYRFPNAVVDSYEPNSAIEKYLKSNLGNFGRQPKMCAVGGKSGMVNIETTGTSLFSITHLHESGTTPQVSFAEAIQSLGGAVDLVKLDCEGAEWEIFKCEDAWRNVRFLVMEYHLWAKQSSTYADVVEALHKIGFEVTHHAPSPESIVENDFGGTFGLLHAKRRTL